MEANDANLHTWLTVSIVQPKHIMLTLFSIKPLYIQINKFFTIDEKFMRATFQLK